MTLAEIQEASTRQAEKFVRDAIEQDRAWGLGIYDEWLADKREELRHEFKRREATRMVASQTREMVGPDPLGPRGDDVGED